MLFWKKDAFAKDIILLLLVSILGTAVFAAGFALATDQYFAKAVSGVIGDVGQCDLLFQTRDELKGAMVRQIRQVIAERFPGATLKAGISIAGKASFFLTLPPQYKNRAIYNSLGYYFNNLPGNGGFSVMTEPRFAITSVPAGVFDLLAKQVEEIPGVGFTFNDGGSIGVILKNATAEESVIRKVKELLGKYQILEIRLAAPASPEELMTLSKKVSQSLIGMKDLDYVRDITMSSGTDDYQYLVNTLYEVKKFLLAYAAEVRIQPRANQTVAVGDLLVINGQNNMDIKPGALLEPLEVVVKITAKDSSGIRGLIIQGDAGFLRDNQAYRLLPGDKIGALVGAVEVSSRKSQLVYAMDQGIKLLDKLNSAITDFNNSTGGAGLTVSGIENVYQRLIEVDKALKSVEFNITNLNGQANRGSLTKMVSLLESVGADLDYLAKTFGRVRILENRFNQAIDGLKGAQFLIGNPVLQNSISQSGGIYDKIQLLDNQLGAVENSLRERIQKLDDFINRFNPLVAVLLSWRNKARDFAAQIDNFGTAFTPGNTNYRNLIGLIRSTDQIITNITGFNLPDLKSGLRIISDRVFGSDKIDLSALIAEIQRVRDSLPKLLDEEIGHSVNLIDKYVGGETSPGESVQIFTKAQIDRELVDAVIRDIMNNSQIGIFSLPVGTIQPDIRGELYKILAEVRSTIAALIVLIFWILTFILDQSLIISMLKLMDFSFLPKKYRTGHAWLDWGYHILLKILNPANLYAVVISGIFLGLTFPLAGARIPYVNDWVIGILGGLFGIVISIIAEKINPISKDEVLAGLSLGLPFKTIMREIVIPAGRPGMLQLLNRWKMVIK
jgi:hypothetical protein